MELHLNFGEMNWEIILERNFAQFTLLSNSLRFLGKNAQIMVESFEKHEYMSIFLAWKLWSASYNNEQRKYETVDGEPCSLCMLQ